MKTLIAEIILKSLQKAVPPGKEFPEIVIEVPKNTSYGDYSTNAAIVLSRLIGKTPYVTAELLIKEFDRSVFEKIEPARNGFINFTVKLEYLQKNLIEIHHKGKEYAKSRIGAGKKVLLEFVSANPTGPLHVGHGRWAVIGDDIASLLQFCGYKVDREFYVNDVGNQIKKLEESVKAAIKNEPAPKDGYGGIFIAQIAERLKERIEDPNFTKKMLSDILEEQKKTLKSLNVYFDNFFFESALHEDNLVEAVISELTGKGFTHREGGALWFKSEDFGDDKNRVLVRESGETTYFAADIAYHINKFNRGYDSIINVWGADHHGYVPRLKAALTALEYPAERFEVIIGQLVSLYRGAELVRMSKRTGDMVTLEEVISEIGSDAARFFMTMTSANQRLDFDLELAVKKAADNPVYYIQYAHARICSIFKKAGKVPEKPDLHELSSAAERALMKKLLDLKDEVVFAAQKREPHQIVGYLRELAQIFHNFYHQHKVMDNPARLYLADAARIVIKNMLNLLKINAPEEM